MAEHELIQRQREILRAFRQASTAREKLTADLSARLSADRNVIAESLKLKDEQVTTYSKRVTESHQAACKLLEQSNRFEILDQVFAQPTTYSNHSGDPIERIKDAAEESERLVKDLGIAELGTPFARGIRSLIVAGFTGIISIVWSGFCLFSLWALAIRSDVDEQLNIITFTTIVIINILIFLMVSFIMFLGVNRIPHQRNPWIIYSGIVQAVADSEWWNQIWLGHVHQEQQKISAIEFRCRAETDKAIKKYEDTISKLVADNQNTDKIIAGTSPKRGDPLWQALGQIIINGALKTTTIGQFTAKGKWHNIKQPSILWLVGNRSLLFETNGANNSTAVQATQSFLLRLLTSALPGKLRFTFIDPVGLGQNVAPFMHLADYDEQLVTGKAWTESQHIEQRLADLTEHIENVIQKYLRNQFATIEDYNAKAGEVAEPYRVLVVMDFPANFSEAAARRLVSIAQNGPRCGVYAVILVDTDKPLPYNFNLADLERASTVIAWDATQHRFVWQDDDFKDCQLELDKPPPAELFKDITEKDITEMVGKAAQESSKVQVPFERIAPPQAEWWTGDSRDGLRVALGPSGARKVQYLDLGKATAQHALVAGKTGSGKSTLLHTLITNLALTYSPSEVELYLIDFKKGVEFKTYAAHQLPHARVIAIESEREFGLSVLQGLNAELKRRGDLFRAAGVDGLADYRNKISKGAEGQGGKGDCEASPATLPRILLLVDEFQEFFTEDDSIATQSSQVLDRLVRQGRAFGIHVLLGSQTLAGAYTLARSTIDQMAVRIALQCSEADSRLILADDNGAARLLTRPGEAIYNAANGRVEGNNNFQVAWLDDDKRDHYLDRVSALAQAANYKPAQSQIIFEGNAPAQVEKNRALADAITSRASGQGTQVAWLGEPIAIRDAVFANFRRQSGSNLLIVGQQDEAALGMMSVALIGLAAQSLNPSISMLDFGATDSANADYFDRLAKHVPHTIKVGRRRQLPDIINELATEVQRRIDADEANVSSRFLFVYGLQRARDLRQDDNFMPSFDSTQPVAPNPAQQFATILREGPDVGIHTLVYCDTLTNLNRNLDRRALREFGMRVIFQMSQEDSANLIDSPAASKLGQHRAFYYNEEEGRLEKFRPYALPSDQWLTWVGEQLRKHKS